jgi:hypothetical protein
MLHYFWLLGDQLSDTMGLLLLINITQENVPNPWVHVSNRDYVSRKSRMY